MSSITKSIATLPTIHTMSGSTTKPCATDCKAPVRAIQRLNRRSNSSITWNASVSRRSTSAYLVPAPSTSTTSMRCSPTWVRMATTCDRGVLCGRLSVILSRSLICRQSMRGKFRRDITQNSALNFSVCANISEEKLASLILELSKEFKVRCNTNVDLLTIRNHSKAEFPKQLQHKQILLQQQIRDTRRYVLC